MFCRRLREYAKFLKSLLKTNIYLLRGMWKLTKLPQPAITVFGGSRIDPSSEICNMARHLTHRLAAENFSIITGGGPGIMGAANQGAIEYLSEKHKREYLQGKAIISVGIGLINLNVGKVNPYIQENIEMEHFFSRKWLLARYSVGFVVFPGGFGTMDELFEIVTLVQCNRMFPVPIILIDSQYWSPLLSWIKNFALKDGLITDQDMHILTVIDNVQDAVDLIKAGSTKYTQSVLHTETTVKK